MKKFALFFGLLLTVGSVSSCNTYIGFGRDIQKLGEVIQESGYKQGLPSSSVEPNPYGVPAAQKP